MADAERFLLWIVDDRPDIHDMVRASFSAEVLERLKIRSFLNGQSCIDEIRTLATNGVLPDFILLDFFLGDMIGTEVLNQILPLLENLDDAQRPVIIAHSSERRASEAMVKKGADFLLPKIKDGATSPHIEEAFDSLASIQWMRSRRCTKT